MGSGGSAAYVVLRKKRDEDEHPTKPQREVGASQGPETPQTGFLAVPAIHEGALPLRRATTDIADPLGGQNVPRGIADVLRRRRGQGQPLPETTRQGMSDQFGVDLSPVRIHNDAESHHVAEAVQSVAFTHGRDIYFSRGNYNPESSAGQHILAHELAHVTGAESAGSGPLTIGRANNPAETTAETTAKRVVAQLRRSYRPPRTNTEGELAPTGDQPVARHMNHLHHEGTVRRMSIDNTDWASATSATHSQGGGIGVIIVNDGGVPVAVKAGEDFTEEAAVASKLITASVERKGGNAWAPGAPEARTVEGAEIPAIERALRDHLSPQQLATKRTEGFLTDLHNNNGVMVFGFAAGREIGDVLQNDPQVEQRPDGKWAVKDDSMSNSLMSDPGLMVLFGRVSAVDIVLGNFDRFVGKVNFENVMIDTATKSVSFIDNVEANEGSPLRNMPHFETVGKEAFKSWTSNAYAQNLATNNSMDTADKSVSNIIEHFARVLRLTNGAQGSETDKAKGKRLKSNKSTQKGSLEAALESRKVIMTKWFDHGLSAGRDAVLKALQDPEAVAATVSAGKRDEVMTSLLARRFFLSGLAADEAWDAAVEQVRKLAARRLQPQAQQQPAQQQAPQQPAQQQARPDGPPPRQQRTRANAVGAGIK